jgi:hypothetical protein
MPSQDLNFSYGDVKSKINAAKTYNQVRQDIAQLSKKKGDNEEVNSKKNRRSKSEAEKEKKRSQKKQKTQLDELVDIASLTNRKGANTIEYLKKTFVRALANCKPKLVEILLKESINTIGCSQDQEFNPNQPLYIPVRSIDLLSLLKKDPSDDKNKILYEKQSISVGSIPFAMNKELYNRIQSLGTSFFNQYGQYYKGASGQNLFDIEFVLQDGLGNPGQFYKVTLQSRSSGINKISETLKDYYASLDILDFNNVIAMLFEMLTGFLSIQSGSGNLKIGDFSKFQIILQRILGLCFDSNKEIDVAGTSKTSELDEVDESFFEFTSVDLFEIEERINNIYQGVIVFEDCDNVNVPIDPVLINDAIIDLIFISGQTVDTAIDNASSAVVNASNDSGFGIKINFDLSLLKNLPKSILFALLSPKVLLPIMVMLKSLGSTIGDLVKSLMDFVKKFFRMVSQIMSQIGAIFIQELFNIIKKDIQNLIQAIILDVTKETSQTRLRIILRLIEIILTVARLIKDWRECKGVVDEILQLLKIAISGFGDTVPKPLLIATKLLSGYSASRAFVNSIEEYQKVGLPTGPMPDGSPNLGLASLFSQLKANKKEEDENSKVEGITGYGTWVPGGIVMPMNLSGKKI